MRAVYLQTRSRKHTSNMFRSRSLHILRQLLLLMAGFSVCWCHQVQPKLIDCHVHHNGSNEFLQKLITKLEAVQGMAMLITAPKDLQAVIEFMKSHPGRLVGLGEIQL